LQGSTWWSGTALWHTLVNAEYAPMNFKLYVDLMRWLTEYRPLWELVMTGGAVFTLALEIGLPFLIWHRSVRGLLIGLSVLLHTGIALAMGLNTFGLMMLCMLLAFVPPSELRRFLLLRMRDSVRRDEG
jgi:hypothetical protein